VKVRTPTRTWLVWCPMRGIDEDDAIELEAALDQRPDTIAWRAMGDLPPGRWVVFVEAPDERVHRVEVRRP
jgi:hypothetical protein